MEHSSLRYERHTRERRCVLNVFGEKIAKGTELKHTETVDKSAPKIPAAATADEKAAVCEKGRVGGFQS